MTIRSVTLMVVISWITVMAMLLTLIFSPPVAPARSECFACNALPCGSSAECPTGCVCAGGPGVGTCIQGR